MDIKLEKPKENTKTIKIIEAQWICIGALTIGLVCMAVVVSGMHRHLNMIANS